MGAPQRKGLFLGGPNQDPSVRTQLAHLLYFPIRIKQQRAEVRDSSVCKDYKKVELS